MQNMSFGSFEQVEDQDNFDPVPVARYQLRLTNLEFKQNTAGTGSLYAVTLKIEGPTHEGRIIFENWNVQHQNPQVAEIGLKQIKQFVKAAGRIPEGDITTQFIESLEGSLVEAQVGIEIDKNGKYDPKNVVKRFYPVQQDQAQAQAQPQTGRYTGTIAPPRTDPHHDKTPINPSTTINPTQAAAAGNGHPEGGQNWQAQAGQSNGQPWNQ